MPTSSTITTAVSHPTTAARARPLGKQGEDPGQGQHVDGGRDRELHGLQPHRGAGDDPRIDDQTDERDRQHGQHEDARRGQRRASPPQPGQHGCRTIQQRIP